jgi:hypothetical protein
MASGLSPVAKFTINKSILLKALLNMVKVVGRASKQKTTLEITVTDDNICLVVPGINLKVPAVTENSAKFTVRLLYFTDIVKTHKYDSMHFIIEEGKVIIDYLTFKAQTTFFENDDILRSVDLPVNFNAAHLIKMADSGRYTPSEIKFNSLEAELANAMKILNADISKIALISRKYGLSRKEVEAFIKTKLQTDNSSAFKL